MSYYIKFEELESSCFTLVSLVLVSKQYVNSSFAINNSRTNASPDYLLDDFDLDMIEYHDWLIHQVHSKLIYCAIQTRILLDQDKSKPRELDLIDQASNETYEKYQPIIKSKGIKNISLRECCNKIIHANQLILSYEYLNNIDDRTSFWNGEIKIQGEYQKSPWEITIDILNLSYTIRLYLSIIKNLI